MAQEIKIFAMNDCDWYAAESVEDALKAMAEVFSYKTTPEGIADMREGLDVENPGEISDESMDSLIFTDDSDLPEGQIVKRTFREQLAQMIADGQKFPCFFASTEY
jgi:hypothetical protein